LTTDADLQTDLHGVWLLRIQIAPALPAQASDAQRLAAERLVRQLDQRLAEGVLATEPLPIELGPWLEGIDLKEEGAVDLAIEALEATIEESSWPAVQVELSDLRWVDVTPGTPWERLLAGVRVGAISRPERIQSLVRRYLVLAERPVELATWADRPLRLELLTYQVQQRRLLQHELERLRAAGAIRFRF
jgi:hypothetical protein